MAHHHGVQMSREHKLMTIIGISSAFFVLEIAIGFRNHSLALVADAFHVCSDLISFVVALLAIKKSGDDRSKVPKGLSYGWQRAELLGAFFNGVFLLALGVSILLQTLERFISPEVVQQPKWVLIVASVGLGLNILSALTVHEHGHDHGHDHGHGHTHGQHTKRSSDEFDMRPRSSLHGDPHANHEHSIALKSSKSNSRDLGLFGVLLHLLGDALNNVAVMVSAGIIMATGWHWADPIASLFVGLMILFTAYPLVTKSGRFLLAGAPEEVDMSGVTKDVERVMGMDAHEVHVWSLTQSKRIATMHVATSDDSLRQFMKAARNISDCLHYWGIHNVTIQPEFIEPPPSYSTQTSQANLEVETTDAQAPPSFSSPGCQLRCRKGCENEPCCT